MLVLLVVNLIVLPVTISFFNDDFSPRWVIFYVGSDAVLLLDVLINFRTGLSALCTAQPIFSLVLPYVAACKALVIKLCKIRGRLSMMMMVVVAVVVVVVVMMVMIMIMMMNTK